MKVTIIEKGEGFVVAKLSAASHVEHLILETCGMAEVTTSVSLSSYDKDHPYVNVGAFALPVHSVLQEKPSVYPGGTVAGANPTPSAPYIPPPTK